MNGLHYPAILPCMEATSTVPLAAAISNSVNADRLPIIQGCEALQMLPLLPDLINKLEKLGSAAYALLYEESTISNDLMSPLRFPNIYVKV